MTDKNKEASVGSLSMFSYGINRIVSLVMFFLIFISNINPVRVATIVNKNSSLFTSAISYTTLTSDVGRGFRQNWVSEDSFYLIMVAAIVLLVGIAAVSVASCLSLGNNKCKRLSFLISVIGTVVMVVGFALVVAAHSSMSSSTRVEKVGPMIPKGFVVYIVLTVIGLLTAVLGFIGVPKKKENELFEMESKYKLFLMFLPFALLAFVFCYLPLWGWRYAFFDYKAGDILSWDKFVGFKWFTYLFKNAATKREIVNVMKNTLAMSFLGIATSWLPVAFAVFLTEIKNLPYRRIVQTFTTIPNFISWILVYTVALSIFSTDGFINTFLSTVTNTAHNTNYLMGDSHTWLKMLLWGTWKGVGWSAIIYIAGISGIDQQLYEAATVDGAGRFQKIWHVTIPGLMPTYMVMLLMGIAGMLSNGLDQYLVFSNAKNMAHMRVLDLYVYQLGIMGGSIPLSTVIGMAKSIISVALLFMANSISKAVRGESIV